jgi:hypothetical protein
MGRFAPVQRLDDGERVAAYDVAQICLNGHVVNERFKSEPQHNQDYCARCGKRTITACLKCEKTIPGAYTGMRGFVTAPAHCTGCGTELPWTEQRIQAAFELFADEVAEAAERKAFEENLRQVSQDGPAAQVAASRLVRTLKKVRDVTRSLIYDVLKSVAGEAAKKILFPG